MKRSFASILAGIGLAAGLQGCAIEQMKRDNQATEARIAAKEAELEEQKRRNAALDVERRNLLVDLRNREMTVAELKARVEKLRALNAATASATAEEKKRRDERARQLADTANQAQVLEQDPTLSDAEKKKRLEALREKTRRMLDVLMTSRLEPPRLPAGIA